MIPFKSIVIFAIQALLVVAAVLVFSYFDPFNIFNTRKLRVSDTSLIINSTKDMGELITAEFYGEVLTSSREAVEIKYTETQTALNNNLAAIHSDFVTALKSFPEKPFFATWKKHYADFAAHHSAIVASESYPTYWQVLEVHAGKSRPEHVFEKVFKEVKLKPQEQPPLGPLVEGYMKDRYQDAKQQRIEKKQKLVLLGRGWVKAGIDFNDFSERSFIYLENQGRIILRSSPKIISATINPWLSPENNIAGWELVEVNGKAEKEGPELIARVKAAALEKLVKQAHDAGIMEKALYYAKENLSAFFTTILGKDIRVEIYGHPLEYYAIDYKENLKKDTLTVEELHSAAGLYLSYTADAPSHLPLLAFTEALKRLEEDTTLYRSRSLQLPVHYRSVYHRLLARELKNPKADTLLAKTLADTAFSKQDYLLYGLTAAADSSWFRKAIRNNVDLDSLYLLQTQNIIPSAKWLRANSDRFGAPVTGLKFAGGAPGTLKRRWLKTLTDAYSGIPGAGYQ